MSRQWWVEPFKPACGQPWLLPGLLLGQLESSSFVQLVCSHACGPCHARALSQADKHNGCVHGTGTTEPTRGAWRPCMVLSPAHHAGDIPLPPPPASAVFPEKDCSILAILPCEVMWGCHAGRGICVNLVTSGGLGGKLTVPWAQLCVWVQMNNTASPQRMLPLTSSHFHGCCSFLQASVPLRVQRLQMVRAAGCLGLGCLPALPVVNTWSRWHGCQGALQAGSSGMADPISQLMPP